MQVGLQTFFTSAKEGLGRHFTLWPLYAQRKSISMPVEEEAAYDCVFRDKVP
jgi:hypothetical protein